MSTAENAHLFPKFVSAVRKWLILIVRLCSCRTEHWQSMMMTGTEDDYHGSGEFEDIEDSSNNDDGAFPLSSLAVALASATANERNRRQRKTLVEKLVRLLFDGMDTTSAERPNAKTTVNEGVALEDETTAATDDLPTENTALSRSSERTNLVEAILGEETGSSLIPQSFSSITPTKKITWNKNQSLMLHWIWQTMKDDGGVVQNFTCNLSVLAKHGATIEFFSSAPPTTTSNGDPQEEPQKIAVCEIFKFQWTLEGTTEKANENGEDLEEVQSFWKMESTTLSWTMGSVGEIAAEEVLLEGRDIALIGKIIDNIQDNSEKTDTGRSSLQLQSKAVLSLKISSVESLGGSVEEKRRVGMALRAMVSFLDQIISVPNLHLSLTNLNGDNEQESANEGAEEEAIPSFEEAGDNNSLGDAMKYYLKYHCSGTNNKQPAAALNRPKFLSMGDSVATFGALAVTGASFISPLGAAVSVAALAAKDSVAAAASKGQEVRLSQQMKQQEQPSVSEEGGNEFANRISLEFDGGGNDTSAVTTEAEPKSDGGYRFGDVTRGLIGSIREKQQQRQQKQQSQHQNESLLASSSSEGNGAGNYLNDNKARFAGVGGGSAGATVGFLVGGPMGAFAGSYLGSRSSQVAVQKHQEQQQQEHQQHQPTSHSTNESSGGFFQNVVARGKDAKREASGRFSGFSRGLFALAKEPATEAPQNQQDPSQHRPDEI